MKSLLLHSTANLLLTNSLRLVIFITLSFTGSLGVLAAQSVEDWQLQRLLHPTAQQRAHERQGHVFIYDGLSDKEVDHALDLGFDRIDSMMFVNVKKSKDNDSVSASDDEDVDTDDAGCE